MQIDIKLDSEARDLLNAFPERVSVASSRAVIRALDGINTDSSKIIRQRYNVKKRDISIGVRKFKATRSRLEGRIEFGGKPIALEKFNPSPKRFTKNKPKHGISVEIRRGKKTLFRSSFMSRAGLIFVRQGKERLPIKHLYGPRIYQMIDSESKELIRAGAEERLLTNFKHQMRLGAKYR
ncbi:MAG TPA: phage tail protein [Candidatus Mucispirillum faecigallinarum]|uniref:Phage tail protein n=1 Tax=Candidatus Mucispirillum faecigallinarum TaxID=2838699 RepID=A0A9D2GTG8_9BACT|nr:phage tail protein [Candidatus Mucispirillum faecigallinarum]